MSTAPSFFFSPCRPLCLFLGGPKIPFFFPLFSSLPSEEREGTTRHINPLKTIPNKQFLLRGNRGPGCSQGKRRRAWTLSRLSPFPHEQKYPLLSLPRRIIVPKDDSSPALSLPGPLDLPSPPPDQAQDLECFCVSPLPAGKEQLGLFFLRGMDPFFFFKRKEFLSAQRGSGGLRSSPFHFSFSLFSLDDPLFLLMCEKTSCKLLLFSPLKLFISFSQEVRFKSNPFSFFFP